MFTSTIVLLVPFLVVTFLPLALKSFSSDELDQMGVQLETSETPNDPSQRSNCALSTMTVACGNA